MANRIQREERELRREAEKLGVYSPTIKKRISPVKVTLEVTVNRVNANGTLSGVEIVSVNSKAKDIYATCHQASGGSIWLKTPTLDGLQVISDAGANAKKKTTIKLF